MNASRHGVALFMTCAMFYLQPSECLSADDWLIDPSPFPAVLSTNGVAGEISLENGLVRRAFKLSPDAATVAFDNLMTGESILRSVRPEAQLTLDGKSFNVGGLTGQPIDNFLTRDWLAQMGADPAAFHFDSYKTGPTEPRFPWLKRTEW